MLKRTSKCNLLPRQRRFDSIFANHGIAMLDNFKLRSEVKRNSQNHSFTYSFDEHSMHRHCVWRQLIRVERAVDRAELSNSVLAYPQSRAV